MFFLEIALHTLKDTAKILPFLFLTYLLMEFLEHRSGSMTERWLRRSGKIGPLVGGALGIAPQCGFSAAASGLYAGRVITTGTLIAVYLSTSDEMLPIMISKGAPLPEILKLLITKLILGVAAGFAIDWITSFVIKKRHAPQEHHHEHAHHHHHEHHEHEHHDHEHHDHEHHHDHDHSAHPHITEFCERENCKCEDGVLLSALKHTAKVAVFILLITYALNAVIHLIGEDTIASVILDRPVLGNLIAALVGLIPNCASSVILTEMYLAGVVPIGATLSGLLVNSGIALAILFRNNRPLKDSFRILLLLFVIGFVSGTLIDLTGILG